MDIFDRNKRSEVMSKVARQDNPQEILVRSFLFNKGFRFRKNYRRLPGSPDIVLPKYKTAIFIHGCFWHGHSCRAGNLPKSNVEFWNNKITNNKKRDRKNNRLLREQGWRVIIIWQCGISNKINQQKVLKKLVKKLNNILDSLLHLPKN